MSLLEYEIKKKGWIDKTTFQLKFEANNKNKKYKVKRIWDSAMYVRGSGDHLQSFIYRFCKKAIPKKKSSKCLY